MKLLRRQPRPEPEEDDDERAPPFGVHPLIDLMAMQHYMLKQHVEIWRALAGFHKRQVMNAKLWLLVSVGFIVSSALSIWASLDKMLH